jgi:precorrin-4/cobalt-precorrin-4 C11-methyltransferase
MISFVGAGPGAPDLITLRGAARLAKAEVVVWASSLVPEVVLEHCRPKVEVHDSATMTLEDVLDVYAAHDEATPIVRLHSGDPAVYGAIAEQMDWCLAEGRSFEIVPGVSSVGAAAAALERELTVPGVSQSVVLTRLAGRTAASVPPGARGTGGVPPTAAAEAAKARGTGGVPPTAAAEAAKEGVAAFAPHGATMAVFLSAARPDELAAELLAPGSGYGPDTPAAIVVRASWPDEQVVRTTVARLAEDLRATGATMTALVLVGEALADRPVLQRSHLYEPGFSTAYRLRSPAGSTQGRPSARRTDGRS